MGEKSGMRMEMSKVSEVRKGKILFQRSILRFFGAT